MAKKKAPTATLPAGCVQLPTLGPGDKGAVPFWDGERWNTTGPPPGEGATLTIGANGDPVWANAALAAPKNGDKPPDADQPM